MPDQAATNPTEQPDPAVMRGVIPYIGLRGKAAKAAAFYAEACGATELGNFPTPKSRAGTCTSRSRSTAAR